MQVVHTKSTTPQGVSTKDPAGQVVLEQVAQSEAAVLPFQLA